MTPRVAAVELSPINLPMRLPFVTAAGSKRVSRNLAVTIQLEDGTAGRGEASASLAWPDQTQSGMKRALARIAPGLIGTPIERYEGMAARAWRQIGRFPAAVGALECALLEAYALSHGLPLWRWFGGRRRAVTTSLTISARPAPEAANAARNAARRGFRFLKVKLTGRDAETDLERLEAVHQAAPRAALWLDGNQGFMPEGAIRLCREAQRRRLPLRLFEQPVPLGEWKSFRRIEREGGVAVAADESARSAEEALRLIRRRAVSVINVKLAKCGPLGALTILRAARGSGTRLMIGCMAESAAGLWPSVALACGTGAFDYVDLDSHLLTVSPPCLAFTTRGPKLSVS